MPAGCDAQARVPTRGDTPPSPTCSRKQGQSRRVVGERRSAFLGDTASENAPLIAKKHRTRRAGTHDDAVLLPHLGRCAIERGQVGSLLAHRLVGEGAGALLDDQTDEDVVVVGHAHKLLQGHDAALEKLNGAVHGKE